MLTAQQRQTNKKFADFLNKIKKQPVTYLLNTSADAVVKITKAGDNFVRFPSKAEFKAKQGNSIVADALLEMNEISQQRYEEY